MIQDEDAESGADDKHTERDKDRDHAIEIAGNRVDVRLQQQNAIRERERVERWRG